MNTKVKYNRTVVFSFLVHVFARLAMFYDESLSTSSTFLSIPRTSGNLAKHRACGVSSENAPLWKYSILFRVDVADVTEYSCIFVVRWSTSTNVAVALYSGRFPFPPSPFSLSQQHLCAYSTRSIECSALRFYMHAPFKAAFMFRRVCTELHWFVGMGE